MKIAAAVVKAGGSYRIAKKLEDAKTLLIVETDTMEICKHVKKDWVNEMAAWDCEAILCGDMYDPALFEAIAGKGITRYYAAGMSVDEAVKAMDRYELGMITDYVGGTHAQHQHTGTCSHEHDSE